jgi:hypothetical protein
MKAGPCPEWNESGKRPSVMRAGDGEERCLR